VHLQNVLEVMSTSVYTGLRWAGNVMRVDGNELTKKVLWINPGDQQGCGPQKLVESECVMTVVTQLYL
jgi:hypothetical protein